MPIETATKIQDLNPANPLDADPVYQGAAHIRMIKDCLQNPASAFTPTGAVIAFAGAAAPAGWLLCDGATLLKADYPDLAAVLGTIYGPGDSTHFVLPDFRGVFLRGLNTSGSGYDPNRVLGSLQAEDFKSHAHDDSTLDIKIGSYNGFAAIPVTDQFNFSTTKTHFEGGAETRPVNKAVNYIIKY